MSSLVMSRPLTIGAYDLMRGVQCNHSGTLHIPGKTFLGRKKWQSRYLVIAQGCLYVYQDKNANRAEASYTIRMFESVIEIEEDGDERFCFCVKYEVVTKKPLVFACDTDDTRKVWLGQFQNAIQYAQNFSADSGFGSSAGSISATQIDQLRMHDLKLDTEEKGYDEIEDLLINFGVQASTDVTEANHAASNVLQPHILTATTNTCDELLYENIQSGMTQTGNALSMQTNSTSLLSVRGGHQHSDSFMSVRAGSENSDTYHPMSNADGSSKTIPSLDYLSVRNGNKDIYAHTEPNQSDETVPKMARASAVSKISATKASAPSLQVAVTNRLGITGEQDSDSNSCSDHGFESPVEDMDTIYANTTILEYDNYYCDSIQTTKRDMHLQPQGTFLICPGEKTRLDLCVETGNGNGWFHIHEQNGQFSLYKHFTRAQDIFPTLDALLYYYHVHDLPSNNFNIKLTAICPARF